MTRSLAWLMLSFTFSVRKTVTTRQVSGIEFRVAYLPSDFVDDGKGERISTVQPMVYPFSAFGFFC